LIEVDQSMNHSWHWQDIFLMMTRAQTREKLLHSCDSLSSRLTADSRCNLSIFPMQCNMRPKTRMTTTGALRSVSPSHTHKIPYPLCLHSAWSVRPQPFVRPLKHAVKLRGDAQTRRRANVSYGDIQLKDRCQCHRL
jgi:hypothetical protein